MKALLVTLFLAAVFVTAIPVSAGATAIDTQQISSHWHRHHHRHHRY
jgi:Spy/CpxP family protein refolding chaperone